MPRQGVTYTDVESAIQSLDKAGLTPSIRVIREHIGSGSLSTIAEHKRAYDAKQATGPGPALPDQVTQSLMTGARGFWQELVDAAEAQIDAIQTRFEEQRKALDQELEDAREALTFAQETVGELRSLLGERDVQLAEAQQTLTDRDDRLTQQTVAMGRLEAERDALIEQRGALQIELETSRTALTTSQAESAQFSERLERQALESAKDKATLQKHFNEYKDRLVTMSDERRQALNAQRDAEKQSTAAEKQAAETAREVERLQRELTDARDEARYLTETLGEVRGELSAVRTASSEQLADRDTELNALQTELKTAQLQVREYAGTDRSLVEALIAKQQSART